MAVIGKPQEEINVQPATEPIPQPIQMPGQAPSVPMPSMPVPVEVPA